LLRMAGSIANLLSRAHGQPLKGTLTMLAEASGSTARASSAGHHFLVLREKQAARRCHSFCLSGEMKGAYVIWPVAGLSL
jgi:hypothetical protein